MQKLMHDYATTYMYVVEAYTTSVCFHYVHIRSACFHYTINDCHNHTLYTVFLKHYQNSLFFSGGLATVQEALSVSHSSATKFCNLALLVTICITK